MVVDRAAVCESAGKKILASAQKLKNKKVFIGADGFVDSIISVVEKRYSPTKYDAVSSIDAMDFTEREKDQVYSGTALSIMNNVRSVAGAAPA